MVTNGDGRGGSAGKLDEAAALRLLSKLYDHVEDQPDQPDQSNRHAAADAPLHDAAVDSTAPPSEVAMQAEASLRELRSVFATMRESTNEEPPSRGLDALLQAARANAATAANAGITSKAAAPRVAATEPALGFWTTLRTGWMNMMAHPGVMAAAALIVVAGAAGTIYLKTGAVDGGANEQHTQSSVSSTTASNRNVTPNALDSTIVGGLVPGVPVAAGSRVELRNAEQAGRLDQPAHDSQPPGAKATDDNNVVAANPRGGGPGTGAGVNGNLDGDARSGALESAPSKSQPSRSKSSAAPVTAGPQVKKPAVKPSPDRASQATSDSYAGKAAATAEQQASGNGGAPVAPTSGALQPSPSLPPAPRSPSPYSPAPSPPPAPPSVKRTTSAAPAPAAPAPKAPVVQRDNGASDQAPSVANPSLAKPTPQPAALLTAAKLAARRGDCTQARGLAEQARVVDKRAYDLALKNDATLRACYQP